MWPSQELNKGLDGRPDNGLRKQVSIKIVFVTCYIIAYSLGVRCALKYVIVNSIGS